MGLQGNTLRSGDSISLQNSCQTVHHVSENMLMNASCSTRHLGFKSLTICSLQIPTLCSHKSPLRHAGDTGAQLVWSSAVGVQGILPGFLWQVLVVTSTERDTVGESILCPNVSTFSLLMPLGSDSLEGLCIRPKPSKSLK